MRAHRLIDRLAVFANLLWRAAAGCLLVVGSVAADSLQARLDDADLPGIAWATVDGDIASAGGRGLSQIANQAPMTADTQVQVGSVAKTLVALGVLRLVSTNTMSLDDSVESLLPNLKWDNRWRTQAPVTVRHLLEHTAGLDNIRLWQFLNSNVTDSMPLADAFPADHKNLLRIRTRPGTQYSYSNMGYALLGLVIEAVTGERYETVLERELLSPLGMQDSSFQFVTQSREPQLAMGYVGQDIEQPAVPMILRSAGQFTTTADDMTHLLEFMLGNGDLDGNPFIEYGLMSQLGEPTTTDARRSGLAVGHGLALARRDRHGVIGDCHPGTTFGFRAYLCIFREERKAFFYSINADFEGSDYEQFNAHFIQQLNITEREIPARVPTDNLAQYTGLYALAPANMAQFEWLDWLFNSVWVTKSTSDADIVIRSLQNADQYLVYVGDDLFRNAERVTASHVFVGPDHQTLSNGLNTWTRASLIAFALGWFSLIAGVLALAYLILRGVWLVCTRRLRTHAEIGLPWLSLIGLAIPAWLFTRQSFLQFGEITAASVLLATLTSALPILLSIALVIAFRKPNRQWVDLIAVALSWQLTVMMWIHGALPLITWR